MFQSIHNMLQYSSSNTTCSSLYCTALCLLCCTLVKSIDLTNSVKTVRCLSISSCLSGAKSLLWLLCALSWCFCVVPVYCIHKLSVPQSVLPHCMGTSGRLLFWICLNTLLSSRDRWQWQWNQVLLGSVIWASVLRLEKKDPQIAPLSCARSIALPCFLTNLPPHLRHELPHTASSLQRPTLNLCMYFNFCNKFYINLVTGWTDRGSNPSWGHNFSHHSRPDLEHTQPPIQWVSGLSPGVKRPGRGVDHPPTSSAEVKERAQL